ncbi:MAG: hypothetical protein Q4A60_08895 [Pasteurellaceae bacterium]|nr:hypothetical protein [Pasteurellaceae bacterium]
MKTSTFSSSLLAATLACVLTACSGGNSVQYTPIQGSIIAPDASSSDENRFKESEFKEVKIEPSQFTGNSHTPMMNDKKDAVFYGEGPLEVKKGDQVISLADVNFNKNFLRTATPDANRVDTLTITDGGETLGEFQFVNQHYSSFFTFMTDKPANKYDPNYDRYVPLAYYTAKHSTADQLDAQKGSFVYRGKAIGYQGGVHGSTPKQQASTDIEFNVNFDTKRISGKIAQRFDDIGSKSLRWIARYDEDEHGEEVIVYRPEYHTRHNMSWILQETPIEVSENGVVNFGSNGVSDRNAGVQLKDGSYLGISSYSGVFAGPELNEVVGQIGYNEEKVMFGATKENK